MQMGWRFVTRGDGAKESSSGDLSCRRRLPPLWPVGRDDQRGHIGGLQVVGPRTFASRRRRSDGGDIGRRARWPERICQDGGFETHRRLVRMREACRGHRRRRDACRSSQPAEWVLADEICGTERRPWAGMPQAGCNSGLPYEIDIFKRDAILGEQGLGLPGNKGTGLE